MLFDITKKAFTEVETRKTAKIKDILTRLYDYMKTHFKHEEEYIQQINYPAFKEHKKLHSEIISK